MRTTVKITFIILLALVIGYPLIAQTAKDTKKQISGKSVKQARKEAKKFINEGFYVAPGALPLDKQLENAWMKQYEMDQNEYEWLEDYINNNAETGVALASRGSYKTCGNFISNRCLTHDIITIKKE